MKEVRMIILMNRKIKISQQQINELAERLKVTETELALYKEKLHQSSLAYSQLLEAFKQIQRRQFGRRSERFLDASPSQEDMFSDVLARTEENNALSDRLGDLTDQANNGNSSLPASKKPRKKNHSHFAKGLPRREVIIPAEKPANDSYVIRYEITELLHYEPPVYEVIVQKREVVVTQDKETNVSRITIAPNPKRLLPKAKVTNAFLAHIIISKLYDRQPLYHLEKMYGQRFDFICPRNKLARWFIDSAQQMQPLVNILRDTITDYDVAFCDPTHVQVLNEPGRPPEKKSYVFTIKGGPPDKTAVMYAYNPDEHKLFLKEWFADYAGYLHVDGQNIFEYFETETRVQLLFCNAHARRKFEPIDKSTKTPGLATEAMRFYKKLYAIEREAKDKAMTPKQRFELRQEKSKPLIDAYEEWIKEKKPLTLPQSSLGKAMEYVCKRLSGLRRFLDDGRLEIDTNSLEQKNKDLALARNNFLFCQSVEGVEALCIHMSLVVTSLMHGHDPYNYYVYVMEQLPHCTTVEEIEKLLPWNIPVKKQKMIEDERATA
jgi:transposase